MEDLTGKQLGPYQIVAPLGEGGMAWKCSPKPSTPPPGLNR
ncbi:MAG TPA: hypothetical protein VJL59_02675 [Anaerolineales bacterium]|nr:hypothetical protein [Anaerolineales bacterium]